MVVQPKLAKEVSMICCDYNLLCIDVVEKHFNVVQRVPEVILVLFPDFLFGYFSVFEVIPRGFPRCMTVVPRNAFPIGSVFRNERSVRLHKVGYQPVRIVLPVRSHSPIDHVFGENSSLLVVE